MTETPQALGETKIALSFSEADFIPHDVPSAVNTLEEAVEVLRNDIIMSMFIAQMMQERLEYQTEGAIAEGVDAPNTDPATIAYRAATMTQTMIGLITHGAEGWLHRDDENYLYGELTIIELLNGVLTDIHEYKAGQLPSSKENRGA